MSSLAHNFIGKCFVMNGFHNSDCFAVLYKCQQESFWMSTPKQKSPKVSATLPSWYRTEDECIPNLDLSMKCIRLIHITADYYFGIPKPDLLMKYIWLTHITAELYLDIYQTSNWRRKIHILSISSLQCMYKKNVFLCHQHLLTINMRRINKSHLVAQCCRIFSQ